MSRRLLCPVAKLIVWGEDRATAIQRLQQALGDYCIAGLTTNINFLTRLSGHSAFRSAQLSTDFIEQFAGDLLALDEEEVQRHGLLVCLYEALRAGHVESGCPWQGRDNWRMNAESAQTTALLIDGVEQYITSVAESASGFRMSFNDKDYWVTGELAATARSGGRRPPSACNGGCGCARLDCVDAALSTMLVRSR